MSGVHSIRRDRIIAAVAAALIELGCGYLLLTGFPPQPPPAIDQGLHVLTIPTPRTPRSPHPIEVVHRQARPAAPSLPNRRSEATAIVAPPPAVPLIVPPTLIAAPQPGAGTQPTAGAADVRGPGTGSGGRESGNGGGGVGDGDGDDTPPHWRSGRLHDSDFPRAAFEAGAQGTVSVRYTVETDGRATGCTVTRSSGSAILDATTCRLIEKRLRFYPARDAAGDPVASEIVEDHSWVLESDGPPIVPPDPAPPRSGPG